MKAIYRKWSDLGLSKQILIGLGLGMLTGLLVGESANQLAPIADIYLRLMQVTVLPYLITALVVAFGQLDMAQAKSLALRGGLMLLMVWAVMIIVIGLMPLAFPEIVSASFYSSALVEPPQPFSLAEIYFTSNPFEALSRNAVPAIVLFSCMMGVALIGLDQKERLLEPLQVWNLAIVRIAHYVITLTPLGVFALAAVTAGTMDFETFLRLEAYFVAFAAASLLLSFVILPLLVTAVTPFRYREVVSIARDALLTAFLAHSAFIVLPILVERSKELFKRHGLLDETTGSAADVMIPVLFNFPNAGKLMSLLFVPFVAWLSGAPLLGRDYATLFAAGIPSYFAKAQVALPYLFDLFGLPHDMFRLYIPTTIVTGKFDSMLSAMNLLVFAMLGAGSLGGFLVFDRRRMLRACGLMLASLVVTLLGVKGFLALTLDTRYEMDQVVRRMHSAQPVAKSIVHREPLPDAEPMEGDPLDLARARGTLRIGYDPDNLPFSFFNSRDELVGLDVELATHFATSLNLQAEFVPVSWSAVPELLQQGTIDLMPGMWYRPNWFGRVHLSAPYMTGTMALAVRDNRRHEFARVDDLRRSRGLRIGIPLDERQVMYSKERYFGEAPVEWELVEFWRPFFEGEHDDVDAFLMPAEHASGWTLLHPEYTVVVPQPDPIRIATAFGLRLGESKLTDAVNEWVLFAENTGTISQTYDYWVLGQGAHDSGRRWSILRDLLDLGDEDANPAVPEGQ